MRAKITLFLTVLCFACTASNYQAWAVKPAAKAESAAAPTANTQITPDAAWKLYTQRQYAASAAAYETCLSAGHLDARVCYCAALANREAQRAARAKQLFDYLIANFPQSAEAGLAKSALSYLGTPAKPVTSTLSAAGAPDVPALGGSQITATGARPWKKGAFVFTADEIAKDGADGIDQTNAANCWFESSMAALASLPKGQRLIARMITYGDKDQYIVRFPGDGVEYRITEEDIKISGVNNHALWASLLDYAQRKKFPNNQGANGAYSDQSRLEVGLGAITGNKAEMINPGQSGLDEIGSFIGGAVRSQNPVVAGTSGRINSGPQPIIEAHAYTVIGMDTSKNMIILRNPHGRKSRKFEVQGDPQHLRFEQLEDGAFKMNLQTFHDSFGSAARSFI